LGRISIKIAFSLLGAGIFYFAWMTAFLLTANLDSRIVETALWLMAPVATAVGFAVGIAILERTTEKSRMGFLRTLVWPLIGCTIGAGIVYWVGPMLIVFGMFVAGTASVALREAVILWGRKCG
jgi:uncharacterized membrane protein YsdA (DUF1294 family)